MEIRQLQYFTLIAQSGSMTKASEIAYISQQALSKSIRLLEEELGMPLLERSSRGVTLTPYGEVMARRAAEILTKVSSAADEVRYLYQRNQNTIIMALANGLESFVPLQTVFEFEKKHPEVRISTISESDKAIEHILSKNQVDFGIIGGRGNRSELKYTSLYRPKAFLAVNLNNPLSKKDRIVLTDLKTERLLSASSDYYATQSLITQCNLAGFSPDISFQTNNLDYFVQLLEYNRGVFVCPEDAVDALSSNSRIVVRPFVETISFYNVCILQRRFSPSSEIVRELIDYIYASCFTL